MRLCQCARMEAAAVELLLVAVGEVLGVVPAAKVAKKEVVQPVAVALESVAAWLGEAAAMQVVGVLGVRCHLSVEEEQQKTTHGYKQRFATWGGEGNDNYT